METAFWRSDREGISLSTDEKGIQVLRSLLERDFLFPIESRYDLYGYSRSTFFIDYFSVSTEYRPESPSGYISYIHYECTTRERCRENLVLPYARREVLYTEYHVSDEKSTRNRDDEDQESTTISAEYWFSHSICSDPESDQYKGERSYKNRDLKRWSYERKYILPIDDPWRERCESAYRSTDSDEEKYDCDEEKKGNEKYPQDAFYQIP